MKWLGTLLLIMSGALAAYLMACYPVLLLLPIGMYIMCVLLEHS